MSDSVEFYLRDTKFLENPEVIVSVGSRLYGVRRVAQYVIVRDAYLDKRFHEMKHVLC